MLKTDYNANVTEMGGKILGITGLAANAALTAVENKMLDASKLVKKTDYDTKIPDIENNYITTTDYNKLTKNIVAKRIKKKDFLKILILLI